MQAASTLTPSGGPPLLGRGLYRRESVEFGDVKLFAVIVGTVIISIVMPMFGMYSVISGE